MRIITEEEIKSLNIDTVQCVKWVREGFLKKEFAQLPPKISLHPQGDDFFNTMPCILPAEYHSFGVKIVNRIKGNHPALTSHLCLYDTLSGELLALMESNWITSMRTGAVAALSAEVFGKKKDSVYAIMGLGDIAKSVVTCLLAILKDKKENLTIRLLRYKDQAERFISLFSDSDVQFEIADSLDEFCIGSDVIFSCITSADGIIQPNEYMFDQGVTLIPVHTRGFQNCDLFFDKVFADDRGHVCHFANFSKFKYFGEFSDVLQGKNAGRETQNERILCYNIGIGIHDVLFAHNIYNKLKS